MGQSEFRQLPLRVFFQTLHGTVLEGPLPRTLFPFHSQPHANELFQDPENAPSVEALGKKSLSGRTEKLPTYYPERGFGEITERVADAVRKTGGRIHLESPAIEIDTVSDDGVTVYLKERGERREIHGTHLVSTIPLHLFVKMMRPEPSAEVLESTDRLTTVPWSPSDITERQDILDCGYIYLLDRPYNRISEMNKFGEETSPEGENILCLEICCLRGSADWHAPAEELLEKCLPSLEAEGLFRALTLSS